LAADPDPADDDAAGDDDDPADDDAAGDDDDPADDDAAGDDDDPADDDFAAASAGLTLAELAVFDAFISSSVVWLTCSSKAHWIF
jgi:hypothetical protein